MPSLNKYDSRGRLYDWKTNPRPKNHAQNLQESNLPWVVWDEYTTNNTGKNALKRQLRKARSDFLKTVNKRRGARNSG